MIEEKKIGLKEERIRKITNLYYSNPKIQNAIFEFSENRETVPRYFEGFGKRPDSLQYPNDVFEFVKKGATSFHCSEEIWKDPLELSTNMTEKEALELRKGWDLLLDIDSKYIDYSKIMAQEIMKVLRFHGIFNVGIKFSGSKGFHMIVPWKAFPSEINGIKTATMFPEWPRIITKYIMDRVESGVVKKITDTLDLKKYGSVKKYIKGDEKSGDFAKTVAPDLILVSSRHLFRAPYSLHEKTALASIVLTEDELNDFQLSDADPLKVKIKNFTPLSKKNEATELLMQALDWNSQNGGNTEKTEKNFEFKAVKLEKLSEEYFPPSIKKMLNGVSDGRKRALFILINLFRSVGMEKEELEKRIENWNKKNEIPLKQGYVKSQLLWSYRNKIVPPPNFDKDYYKGIGIIPTEEELKYKNPSNYIVKKTLSSNKNDKKTKSSSNKDNFKKKTD